MYTWLFFAPPDIAKVLVPCAAAALVPAQGLALVLTQGLALVPAEATCVLYKLSVVTCAVVPYRVACLGVVQLITFTGRNFCRQKLLPQCMCIVPIRYLCL